MEEYDSVLSQYNETAQSVVDYISTERFIFQNAWFGEGTLVVFENEQFVAPVDYDKVLTVCYGDYMAVEERVTNHPFTTYWL